MLLSQISKIIGIVKTKIYGLINFLRRNAFITYETINDYRSEITKIVKFLEKQPCFKPTKNDDVRV